MLRIVSSKNDEKFKNSKPRAQFYWLLQMQPPKLFCKKGVLTNFVKFTGKYLCQSKKRLWRRCFLVKFAKFLRTRFLQNTFGWRHLFLFKKKWVYIWFINFALHYIPFIYIASLGDRAVTWNNIINIFLVSHILLSFPGSWNKFQNMRNSENSSYSLGNMW